MNKLPVLLLNFSHPLTPAHLAQVGALTGQELRVIDVPVQIDHARPLAAQIAELVENIGLSSDEWQTLPILVNVPGYALATAALLAELHGRMGYFPAIVRLRPVPDSTPPQFEVAEIVNLQTTRNAARLRRSPYE